MKPRSALQHQVVKLASKLPKISQAYLNWGYKQNFDKYAYTTKYKVICFECAHEWNVDDTRTMLFKLTDTVCPKCKNKLKVKESKAWSHKDWGYLKVITTFKGFQIMRIFFLEQFVKKGYEAHYSWMEVVQHWIAPNGKLTVLGRQSNPMGGWRSGHVAWIWGSVLEVRDSDNSKFYINDAPTYPRTRIMKEIYRNGFTGEFHKYHEMHFFHLLLQYPMFETFVKADKPELIKAFDPKDKRWKKYWPQIKICLKNNYRLKDIGMWFDHLEYLEEDHKDIFNPKYICPKDLRKSHQIYIDKENARREKEQLEALLARLEEQQKEYAKHKSKFFGLTFGTDKLKIVVLDHVKEFYLEGKALHHCVYSSTYYGNPDCLIMSARDKENKRLETIEINLEKMKVMQVRGACNKNTPQHKDIVELVKTALPHIEQVHRSKKKRKVKELAE
jgi:hypothetical protein